MAKEQDQREDPQESQDATNPNNRIHYSLRVPFVAGHDGVEKDVDEVGSGCFGFNLFFLSIPKVYLPLKIILHPDDVFRALIFEDVEYDRHSRISNVS